MSDEKKYGGIKALQWFLSNLKLIFSEKGHTHTIDSALSSTSTNPVQNKVIDAEFDAVSTAMGILEAEIDKKSDAGHNHNTAYDTKGAASSALSEAKEYVDTVASGKASTEHNHDDDYDAIGAANTALASAKGYTDTKVSGLASTSSVNTSISTHNTSTTAHGDIRELITNLTTRLNALANSTDEDLDQMAEIVTYIKANKSLIDSITTSKINVSDIVDNLTTSSTSKVLSAKQGVAIKALIDALQSELDSHTHAIADVSGLQSALDGKAASSHGTHVSYSTTAPVMDGTASVGTASTVARSDHKHPTDTSRASQTDLDALSDEVSEHTENLDIHFTAAERTKLSGIATGANNYSLPVATSSALGGVKSGTDITVDSSGNVSVNDNSHAHTIANITNLQSTLDGKASSSHTHTVSQISDLTATATELNYMDGVTSNVQTQLDGKAASSHSHTITASASDDDVVVLTGTNGTNKVTYSASHANSGVTAGTYKSVTVNAKGHVTAGTNPTTLSGYGITDVYTKTQVDTIASGKSDTSHTHSYAGSSSAGGAATSANKLNTDAGSATNPVYFADGIPVKTTYTLGKSVPSNAVFTDTVYTHPSYTARTGVPTANQTPAFGGTFTVSQPVSDATGHITAVNSRTITIPSAVATTSTNGLMSSTDKAKLDATNITYGTCDTAADTAAKVVTLSGNTNWTLTTGSMIMVSFTNTNTASSVTLNVNSTGAYPIWYNASEYTSTGNAYTGYAGRVTTYMFNGTHWVWISNSYDANTQSNTNSTNTSSKIYLVGATSQGSNKTTYSHDTVYAGTDGHVYSNSKQVVNLSDTQALTNKTYNGYTLGAACAKGVDTTATSGSANLITSGAMYTALAGKLSTTGTAAKATADASGNNIVNTYMPKAGGTFTGAITLSADPTANMHAVTKQYVDNNSISSISAVSASGTNDVTLSSTSMQQITLTTMTGNNQNSLFSISSGGIKVASSGTYLISAGAYIVPNKRTTAGSLTGACYIKKLSGSTETELIAGTDRQYTEANDSGGGVIQVSTGAKCVTLASGDILKLYGRLLHDTGSGTIQSSNCATYLTVVKIA